MTTRNNPGTRFQSVVHQRSHTNTGAAVDLLTPDQAADFLKISTSCLSQMRLSGRGPRYSKIGRLVRYPFDELTAWVTSHTRENTSQAA